jgi:hypothetical protein
VSDDFDPILELVAAALRPADGTLPSQPSDDEMAALEAAVGRRFPSSGWRAVGIRHRVPTAIGAMAAAALLSTASVAAAATSVGEPVRVAQSLAYEIGLPVTDPNLSDARATLKGLTDAIQRHDGASAAGHLKKLRTELNRLDFGERSKLMRQIATKTPGIADQLVNGPPPGGDASGPNRSHRTSTTQAGRSKDAVRPPKDTDTTTPDEKTLPTDPGTTVPPDTTTPTDPGTTVPDTTTPTDPGTTVPDTTTPTDPVTTVPDTTTPTDPGTTVPPDTTTTSPQPPPETTTSLAG